MRKKKKNGYQHFLLLPDSLKHYSIRIVTLRIGFRFFGGFSSEKKQIELNGKRKEERMESETGWRKIKGNYYERERERERESSKINVQ